MRFWPPSAPVTFTLCLAAYAALIPRIGYGVSTFLFFLAVFYFAGQRRWPVNLAMSAVAAISFYVLFVRLADMPLPKGIVGV